jgi:hypothetical protein
MFEDLIQPKDEKFDMGKLVGMDGTCIYCPNHKNPLVFEDCTNYEDDLDRIHKWSNVCKFLVRAEDCTFHRY